MVSIYTPVSFTSLYYLTLINPQLVIGLFLYFGNPVHVENVMPMNEMNMKYFLGYWNIFSDEIVLGIFSFLTKRDLCICAKVCKKWCRLA